MKKYILYLFCSIFFILSSCSASKNASTVTDGVKATYGYTEKDAIKVGNGKDGPKAEREYLNRLTGPNGEKVLYKRLGSCCAFKTKNALFGDMGLLDMYEVTYVGAKETVILYLNMYDSGELKAPVGFKLKK